MKPQSKVGRCNNSDQSCYDFTKISEALNLAENNPLNKEAVVHCSNSIVIQSYTSAASTYDFTKMSEALSNCKDDDSESVVFHQRLIVRLGRQAILRSKEKREPLKVKKPPVKVANVKTWRLPTVFNLTSVTN